MSFFCLSVYTEKNMHTWSNAYSHLTFSSKKMKISINKKKNTFMKLGACSQQTHITVTMKVESNILDIFRFLVSWLQFSSFAVLHFCLSVCQICVNGSCTMCLNYQSKCIVHKQRIRNYMWLIYSPLTRRELCREQLLSSIWKYVNHLCTPSHSQTQIVQ